MVYVDGENPRRVNSSKGLVPALNERRGRYFKKLKRQTNMADEIVYQKILDWLTALEEQVKWRGSFAEVAENLFKIQEQSEIVRQQLINVQPHIAQLPKNYQPFIDVHIDLALQAIEKVLS